MGGAGRRQRAGSHQSTLEGDLAPAGQRDTLERYTAQAALLAPEVGRDCTPPGRTQLADRWDFWPT
eukprot:5457292-Alexandrium_andersonii.AAC.1